MKNDYWLASYLYYTEPWETILTEAVKPFAEQILQEGLANQYFFIRYWERGPHIRLRFKGNKDTLEKNVLPRLTTFFSEYIALNPSKNLETPWMKDLPEDKKWYPNNSIQHIAYEPETERYGGEYAILLAEQQFQASSNAVLAIISESEGWSYEKALGAAIQLHLSFAHAIGLTYSEVCYFYAHIQQAWFPRAYYNYEPNVDAEELKKRAEITQKAFEENFQKQKQFLVGFHEMLWNGLQEEAEFENEWMNTWIAEIKNYNSAVIKLQEEKKYVANIPANYNMPKHLAKPLVERLWIYESLIHMTNNRLGIQNRDEAFLGYLIKRSMEELNKN
ncbi:MAG: thiopeptide-type bacteriocin biosynthesis protein [Bacteroidetes bacterium]|nr:thiopeptide-type bacteriocin biosynthesis protein [Bacteroidota bacterium]